MTDPSPVPTSWIDGPIYEIPEGPERRGDWLAVEVDECDCQILYHVSGDSTALSPCEFHNAPIAAAKRRGPA